MLQRDLHYGTSDQRGRSAGGSNLRKTASFVLRKRSGFAQPRRSIRRRRSLAIHSRGTSTSDSSYLCAFAVGKYGDSDSSPHPRQPTGGFVYSWEDSAECSAIARSAYQNTEKSCGLGIAQANHPTAQALRSGLSACKGSGTMPVTTVTNGTARTRGATEDSRIAQTDVPGDISRGVTAAQAPKMIESN